MFHLTVTPLVINHINRKLSFHNPSQGTGGAINLNLVRNIFTLIFINLNKINQTRLRQRNTISCSVEILNLVLNVKFGNIIIIISPNKI